MLLLKKILSDERGIVLRGGLAIAANVLLTILLIISLVNGDTENASIYGSILLVSIIPTFLVLVWKYFNTKKFECDLHKFKVIFLSDLIFDLSQKNAKGIMETLQKEGEVNEPENLNFNILFEFIVFYNHLITRMSEGNAKIMNSQELLRDVSDRLVDMTILKYKEVFICNNNPELAMHLKQNIKKMNNFYKLFDNINHNPMTENLFLEFGKVLAEAVGHKLDYKYITLGSEFIKLSFETMPIQIYLEMVTLPNGYEQVLAKNKMIGN